MTLDKYLSLDDYLEFYDAEIDTVLPPVFSFNCNITSYKEVNQLSLFHTNTLVQLITDEPLGWCFSQSAESVYPDISRPNFLAHDFLFAFLVVLVRDNPIEKDVFFRFFKEAAFIDPSFSALFNLELLYRISYHMLGLDYITERKTAPRSMIVDFFNCLSQTFLLSSGIWNSAHIL